MCVMEQFSKPDTAQQTSCCVGSLGGSPRVPYPYQVMLVHTYSNQIISVLACCANSLRFISLTIHAIKDSIQFLIKQCTIASDQSSQSSQWQLPRVSVGCTIYSLVTGGRTAACSGIWGHQSCMMQSVKVKWCNQSWELCHIKVVLVHKESMNRWHCATQHPRAFNPESPCRAGLMQ